MIGKTIYIFDINHRVYRKDENGRSSGGPIYREHWRPRKIVSETSRSWVTELDEKIPKKKHGKNICFSIEEVEQRSWIYDNRYKLSDLAKRLDDYEKLRAIEKILKG